MKIVKEGRIHGHVSTTGVVTGRMSHKAPNMAQIPSNGTIWGKKCRELFIAPKGKVLVGCDAAGIENRCLAHYLGAYDKGAYAFTVENGDVHAENAKALYGLEEYDKENEEHKSMRNTAKTFLYAFICGAGDAKIASTLDVTLGRSKELRENFYDT